jgi:transposase-like protein
MAEYLGLSRYEHALVRPDYRNGYYNRHLLTVMGDLELLVPRRRKGGLPLSSLSAMLAAAAQSTGFCWPVFV